MPNTSDATAFAEWADVQKGLERPIPTDLQPKVDEFLARASRLLRMMRPRLGTALTAAADAGNTLFPAFVKDMVVDAAERKARNPGGFSHENAGVFSVSRYDDFAKGRITFDPEHLALLDQHIDNVTLVRGPVRSQIPGWRRP